ncbi:MAG TPA: DUF2179 domain-containing protein [Balneolaceae bacterium]|nr:DUF2179 domain-containing protein [Balneolaceae bacterium]
MLESIPNFLFPVFIFFARICDVSLGTLRILFVSKGMRLRAALLGFVEVLIWIIVVAQLIQHLNNWVNYIAYAAGFSAGTFLGISIENKLKVGSLIIRIITAREGDSLVEKLKKAGFILTRVDAEGGLGPVEIVFTVLKRKRWMEAKKIIESFDPHAFYSVQDVKFASDDNGRLPINGPSSAFNRLLRIRKGV